MPAGMRLSEIMTSPVFTIDASARANAAQASMQRNRIHHLVVTEIGKIVGILSDRDLRPVLLSPGLARARVRELMSEDLTTVGPDTPIEEAASLLVVKKIGCLPVVAQGRLVGIVTETDLLAVLVELLGLLTQSTRLDVGVAGGPDAYERIVEIIRAHEGRILSVGAVPGSEGKTVFSVRLEPCDTRPIVDALRTAGFEVLSHRRGGS